MQCGCCIWFWFFGWTGQAWAYALIGLPPPSILMAGRTHCLRRFDHARTVTIRKYHYLMHKVMASRSAKIDQQQGYLSLSSWNEGHSVPAAWLVLAAHAPKVSGSPIWSCQRSILWEDKSPSHKPWDLKCIYKPYSSKFFNSFSKVFSPWLMDLQTAITLTPSAWAISVLVISRK